MKNSIKILIFCFGIAGIFQSCLFQEEDIFKKSASNRIDAELVTLHDVLTGSPYGWKMPYDCNEKTCYRFLLKFTEKDTVSVLSDQSVAFSKTPAISTYSLKRSQGPVLSFDNYNTQLSVLANPGSDNSTRGGDNDFTIYKITEDSIVLKGIKDSHTITMYRANETDEAGYFTNNTLFKKFFTTSSSSPYFTELTFGDGTGISVNIGGNTRYITFLYKNDAGELVVDKQPFDFNGEGFNLWNTVTVKGNSFSRFVWNEDEQNFNLKTDANAKFEFNHVTPFPYSNTVEQYKGKVFALSGYSAWVKSNIYDKLIGTNATYNKSYGGFELAWDIPVEGSNDRLTYFSFKVVAKPYDPDNYFYMSGSKALREDQVSFQDSGISEGQNINKLNGNPYIQRLKELMFAEEGFTVYDDGAGSVYFINTLNSLKWLQFIVSD
jgi:hypothetical protein